MAPSGKIILPNGHFHKDWMTRVKTWFNQPARKLRRHNNRVNKARKLAPRPANPLRPVIRCPTIRYNNKLRLGRGFSLQELKAAGISRKFARTIGISVDRRRRNRSLESLQANVQRLKEYKSKMILFPRNAKKPRADEAKPEEWSKATQFTGKVVLPVQQKHKRDKAKRLSDAEKKFSAYGAIQEARKVKKNSNKKKSEEQ